MLTNRSTVGRFIGLTGAVNVRDLGGLAAFGGMQIAPGRLVRSSSPHSMTAADRTDLMELGVRISIDLRCPWERVANPYEWHGVEVVEAPLVEDHVVTGIFERFESGSLSSDELEDWWRLAGVYDAPFRHIDSVRRVFDTLLGADSEAGVLFHCRTGKDRTGMIAAIVLEALGVGRHSILQDFLLSNNSARTRLRAMDLKEVERMASASRWSPAAVESLKGVKAEWLDELFGIIEATSGSTEAYITDVVGIGASGVSLLRERFLESAEH